LKLIAGGMIANGKNIAVSPGELTRETVAGPR
jgi:hypothetical protein